MNFIYPRQCEVCGRVLNRNENLMCLYCYLGLPRTNFHLEEDNPVARLFWGRIWVDRASAYFFFNKGSMYQELIHKLKYRNRQDIGIEMGKLYGYELRNSCFGREDLIVPVPLHPKKQKKRGYNQSELIAEGLAAVFEIPVITGNLIRTEITSTQTRKSRFDRFLNISGKFDIRDKSEILGKNILLVDDVVTTGSTLEACGEALLQAGCSHLSVLTLAVA